MHFSPWFVFLVKKRLTPLNFSSTPRSHPAKSNPARGQVLSTPTFEYPFVLIFATPGPLCPASFMVLLRIEHRPAEMILKAVCKVGKTMWPEFGSRSTETEPALVCPNPGLRCRGAV